MAKTYTAKANCFSPKRANVIGNEYLEEKTEIRKAAEEFLKLAAEVERRKSRRKIYEFYPDTGPLRRELYKPHMAFFGAGKWARERCMIAANGIGKTEGVGGYELALHLTGLYPDWWEGRRFKHPIKAWAAGDTAQTTRDILQEKLLGSPGMEGTGVIPGDTVKDIKKKPGNIPDAIESIKVKHISGGLSKLGFKSYDQGRRTFQGTEQHVILLDEEAPSAVYDECLMRTRTVDGMILNTFTPLMGLTDVVLKFMPNGKMPENGKAGISRFIINATWEDAPHLTEKEREEILDGTLPHLRDARSKGIPHLGAGAVYPILEEEIWTDDFELPPWYPRAYALDVGWNCTAALWMAWDRESDIRYLYSAHKQGHSEPASHVAAILARGHWIPGVIDPASIGASQRDGKRLVDEYSDLGLALSYADNAKEAGVFAVWQLLVSGRLKVFKSLVQWFNEFRIYRRDENGKIAEGQDDHLMDCTRYLVLSGTQVAALMPFEDEEEYFDQRRVGNSPAGYFGIY